MTMEANRRMDAYYKQVENAFNTMNDEDQASIDRQLKRLKKMKAKAAKMLEFTRGGNYMDGVNVHPIFNSLVCPASLQGLRTSVLLGSTCTIYVLLSILTNRTHRKMKNNRTNRSIE